MLQKGLLHSNFASIAVPEYMQHARDACATTMLAEHAAIVCDAFTEMQLIICSMHMKLLHDIADDQTAYMIHLVFSVMGSV